MSGKVAGAEVARVRRVAGVLAEMYGDPPHHREDPLDVLVKTVLSQNTTDINSERAYRRLKEAFPSWKDVRQASCDEVARTIVCGGLASVKAERIRLILDRVREEAGGSESLDFLLGWDPDRALEYLMSLDGVGPKTAACVLLFGLGMPAFPVDTHVLRVSKRLGLIPEGTGREEAHRRMAEIVPAKLMYPLHLNMIAHGRRVCRPRNPKCEGCLLVPECKHGQKENEEARRKEYP